MKKLLAVPFLILLFLLAVACGSSEPTVAANPQSASEIKQAAVDFFGDWL